MSISHLFNPAKEKSELQARIIDLTPKLARQLLEKNPGNRRLSQYLVETYKSDIISGRWRLNGEPIIISDTGELNDGQHRCQAVIEANRSIPTLIVEGVPRDARFTTDMGRARRPQDLVAMAGIKNATMISATATLLETVEKHDELRLTASGRDSQLTKQEVFEFSQHNLDELDWAVHVVENSKAKYFRKSILSLAAILISRRAGHVAAEIFIRDVMKGDKVNGAHDPIYVTREKLLTHSRKNPLTPHNMMEIIIKGWNAYRRNKSLQLIRITETWPEIAR